jgi:hypothetical protein
MTDADTARSLRWQQGVNGDATKLASWKIEATALPGLQFCAYMQPGKAFPGGRAYNVHYILHNDGHLNLP